MHIGFDAKRYFHNRTGLGNYSRDLINTLIQQHPDDQFFLYDRKPSFTNLPTNTITVPPTNGGGFLWKEWKIQKEIKMYMLDVYHGLSNELPFGKWPDRVKKIVSIHDVIFRHYPEQYAMIDRQIYHHKTKHAISVADIVIATSYATAEDLQQFYKADPAKLKVVYQTCGEQHRALYSEAEISAFARAYRLPEKFIVYVSSFQTRKNHLSLLKAFASCKGAAGKLVLAGKPGNALHKVKDFIREHQLQDQVVVLTDVDRKELPLLYRAASGFVYPSMIEGFGIPLIEAAHAGLPMAVNNIAVFNELSPEGSIKFDSANVSEFSKALIELSKRQKSDYTNFLQAFNPLVSAETVYGLYL